MSEKIKSKDLSYDSALPPFLQRLRAQHTGQGDPDRHERPIARPKRAKDLNDDDGPTVVDESGDILSKQEYESLTKEPQDVEEDINIRRRADSDAESKGSGAVQESHESPIKVESKRNQSITDGKLQKKRKVARIIGDESSGDSPAAEDVSEMKILKKPKKKTRVIKLAFDE